MDRNLICPCGLTCCDCLFYKDEIYEAAKKLKEVIKKHDFDIFLDLLSDRNGWLALGKHLELSEEQTWNKIGRHFDSFKNISDFMSILDSILSLHCQSTCYENDGCSIGGNTQECSALKCIKDKGYDGCWQCNKFEDCEKLELLKNNYGYVIEDNLKIIKEKGIEEVKSRGNKYYAWQRRTNSNDI